MTKVKISRLLTLKISMSDLTRRVNSLQKWFERLRHALAFDFVFARVHKTLWLDPAIAAGVVERNLEKEDCVSVYRSGSRQCCPSLKGRVSIAHAARCFMPESQTVPTIPSTR
jgi:hypothetical protein